MRKREKIGKRVEASLDALLALYEHHTRIEREQGMTTHADAFRAIMERVESERSIRRAKGLKTP